MNLRQKVSNLEIKLENLLLEFKTVQTKLEILESGRFKIGRTLDKEGDTVHWLVTELFLEQNSKWTPPAVIESITVFKTKKECWEHIRKRRKELKNERPYFD